MPILAKSYLDHGSSFRSDSLELLQTSIFQSGDDLNFDAAIQIGAMALHGKGEINVVATIHEDDFYAVILEMMRANETVTKNAIMRFIAAPSQHEPK